MLQGIGIFEKIILVLVFILIFGDKQILKLNHLFKKVFKKEKNSSKLEE